MLFAITSRNFDGSDKKVIAVQEGDSWKAVFNALLPVLEQVAKELKETPPYMKNHETWGINDTLFSIEGTEQVRMEEELIHRILKKI